MELPRVNPVGIVVQPDDHTQLARTYSRRLRLVAALVLATFATVSIATTVYSLGAYCLTSGTGPIGLLGF
jgi:hypothetical protein